MLGVRVPDPGLQFGDRGALLGGHRRAGVAKVVDGEVGHLDRLASLVVRVSKDGVVRAG